MHLSSLSRRPGVLYRSYMTIPHAKPPAEVILISAMPVAARTGAAAVNCEPSLAIRDYTHFMPLSRARKCVARNPPLFSFSRFVSSSIKYWFFVILFSCPLYMHSLNNSPIKWYSMIRHLWSFPSEDSAVWHWYGRAEIRGKVSFTPNLFA